MKKLYLIAFIIILGNTSCKRNWTCTCTYPDPNSAARSTMVIMKTKGKDARKECDYFENTRNSSPYSTQLISCELNTLGYGF